MSEEKVNEGIGRQLKDISDRLAALERKTDANAKALRIMQEVIVHGATNEMPWHKLKPPRMKQVMAVLDFLREHPSCSIRHAARRTFAKVEGGYQDAENLASYCYDHKLKMYI